MPWHKTLAVHFGEMGPALFLVDLDGTLIDSIPDLASAVNAVRAHLNQPVFSTAEVSHWVGNGIDMRVRRALAGGNEAQALALAAAEIARAREVFDAAYLSVLTKATGAYAGVELWLQTCAVPKVLITNKSRKFTEPLLQALGWQAHFVQVICGDDLAEKKPSAMPLLFACQTQQVAREKTVMVGDSRHDILAAKNASIFSVAVNYGYNHGEDIAHFSPDWVVGNLMELGC
jgi:phosphoglycolate phosphatase